MATVTGTPGSDVIHVAGDGVEIPSGYTDNPGATEFDDSIVGAGGADILYAGAGNDTIVGGLGIDVLYGGDGDDVFLFLDDNEVSGLAEKIDGGAGLDRLVLMNGPIAGPFNFSQATLTGIEAIVGIESIELSLTLHQLMNLKDVSVTTLRLVDPFSGDLDLKLQNVSSFHLSNLPDFVRIVDESSNPGIIYAGGGADTIEIVYKSVASFASVAIDGGDGDDSLYSRGANGSLRGGLGNDLLVGGRGSDGLIGDTGADTLRGGRSGDSYSVGWDGDPDVIRIDRVSHSRAYTDKFDRIGTFQPIWGDKIDISRIDADVNTPGNQSFFLATALTGVAGQLVLYEVYYEYTIVRGDVTGDGIADLEIHVSSQGPISGRDFLL